MLVCVHIDQEPNGHSRKAEVCHTANMLHRQSTSCCMLPASQTLVTFSSSESPGLFHTAPLPLPQASPSICCRPWKKPPLTSLFLGNSRISRIQVTNQSHLVPTGEPFKHAAQAKHKLLHAPSLSDLDHFFLEQKSGPFPYCSLAFTTSLALDSPSTLEKTAFDITVSWQQLRIQNTSY